jgi:peroxiredoxin
MLSRMTDSSGAPRRWRRTAIAIALPTIVAAGYFAVTAVVRGHVDGLIQHSVGQPLPAFRLVDRAGVVWSNADLAGRRAVLHFFRSRCHSCDVEAVAMRELEGRMPSDTVLLHVMTDDVLEYPEELTAETLANKAFTRPVLMADEAFLDSLHRIAWSHVTPITYVVDREGVVRFGLRGAQSVASVEQALALANA